MRQFPRQLVMGIGLAAALAGCSEPLDIDMRGAFGNAPSTAEAAFRALDGDKNGALSSTELATGMAEGRAPPSRIVEQAEDILSTLLDAPTIRSGAPAASRATT